MAGEIVSDPDILGGVPCIAGTRIPARAVWSFHETGRDVAGIIEEYPSLTPEQVQAAIDWMKAQPREIVETFALKFKWYESGIWMLTSDNIKGLLLTTHTFAEMLEELEHIVPTLMHLNGQAFPAAADGRRQRP